MTAKRKSALPLRQPGDSERMMAAIEWALAARLPVSRPTMIQLKIGPLNFYPDKGSFHREGAKAGAERGLRAFREAVAEWEDEERREYR